MENKTTKTKKFFKKFGFYILAGCLGIAIILSLTLGLNKSGNTLEQTPSDPVVDVDTTPLVFTLPIENAVAIKGFSSTELMYNSTLKQWEAHKALDLTSQTSKMVVSCLDGKVTKVDKTYKDGVIIEIEHGQGFVSCYSSLKESLVKVGDQIKAGQNLGEISTTAANESASGEHLHFTLSKNGAVVDPSSYLELSEK